MGSMPPQVGIVLAGGQSRRFGRPKAWATIQGMSFVEHLYTLLGEFFSERWVVLHQSCPDFEKMNTLIDEFRHGGPLNGIYSALSQRKCRSIFVTACDLPFLHRGEVELLLEHWQDDLPALVFKRNGQWEPLCGIYHFSLLPLMEGQLKKGDFVLKNLLESAGAKYLDYDIKKGRDRLININTPEEYAKYLNSDGSISQGGVT